MQFASILYYINNWPINCAKLQIKGLPIIDKLLIREVGRFIDSKCLITAKKMYNDIYFKVT